MSGKMSAPSEAGLKSMQNRARQLSPRTALAVFARVLGLPHVTQRAIIRANFQEIRLHLFAHTVYTFLEQYFPLLYII